MSEKQESSISDEQLSELIEKKIEEKMESEEIKTALKQVVNLEAEAKKLIAKATSILDEHGIGMYFGVSPLGQAYVSNGELKASVVKEILEMHPDLHEDELNEAVSDNLTNYDGFYSEYGDEGWQHSAVC